MHPRYPAGWPKAVPDARGIAWALAAGILATGYFVILIALGTNLFVANGGPTFPPETFSIYLWLFAAETLFLFWHRVLPVASFIAVELATFAALAVLPEHNLAAGLTLLFAIYNMVARVPASVWGWLVPLSFVADVVLQLVFEVRFGTPVTLYAIVLLTVRTLSTYVAPLLAGLLVASHQRRAELAAERERLAAEGEELAQQYADTVQREQRALVAAALVGERNRMARELHDVAAHHLSSILFQTEAAISVQESDPETRSELLRAIKHDGNITLSSLKEVIGVLRADAEGDADSPTLGNLSELIASVRATHPNVDLEVDGEVTDLSPAASLACYRIIQECLSNARKHAPGSHVAVRVSRTRDELSVEVRNTAPTRQTEPQPGPGGFGVLGMRERASMLGGWLDSGSTDEGGWRTHASIPIGARIPA